MDITLLSIFGLLIFIACFSLAVVVLIFGKQRIHKIWAVFNFSNAIWGLSLFFIGDKSLNINNAVVWWKIAHISAMFISVSFLQTVLELCNVRRRIVVYSFYFIDITFFIFLNLFNEMGYTLVFMFNSFFYARSTNFMYIIATFSWFAAIIYGFFILCKEYKRARGAKKNQIGYLLFPVFIAFLGGSSHFLTAFGLRLYPLNIVMVIYPIIVTYAILRYRLMDIRILITKAVAFFITYPFLLGIPFFFGYRMYRYLYPVMGKHWWLVPSGMLVFIATMAPVAYGRMRHKMEGKLLAEQKQYQKLLLQAASGMVTRHDLGRLSKLIVYILKRAVKIEFTAIFLDDGKEGVYRLRASRDHGKSPYKNVTFLYEHPFIDYLRKKKEPVFFEEIPEDLRKTMTVLSGVNLIVPSSIEDNLLGFVLLGEKENKQPYGEDDINVFRILSNQAALAIENCIFINEFKLAQEKIFTAEKLASIGGMADGVAHQIKNRLNQFSVASGELKYEIKDYIAKNPDTIKNDSELKKTLDYITQISESLLKNVKRTDDIIKSILNFARVEEKETFFSYFSLKEVIDLSVDLLKVKHETTKVPLAVDLGSSGKIYGVKSQITEAVYNILDNAYEAIQEKCKALDLSDREKFVPKMEVKLSEQATSYLIEMSDNGSGIDKKNEHKIFAPFFTTKSSYKSGTGIGMYVVKRMVEENHHGKVWFKSVPGEGVTFYIELPKK